MEKAILLGLGYRIFNKIPHYSLSCLLILVSNMFQEDIDCMLGNAHKIHIPRDHLDRHNDHKQPVAKCSSAKLKRMECA